MSESSLKILDCGHVYSYATWKEGATCFYCEQLRNDTANVTSLEYKSMRGYMCSKDGKSYSMKRRKTIR